METNVNLFVWKSKKSVTVQHVVQSFPAKPLIAVQEEGDKSDRNTGFVFNGGVSTPGHEGPLC